MTDTGHSLVGSPDIKGLRRQTLELVLVDWCVHHQGLKPENLDPDRLRTALRDMFEEMVQIAKERREARYPSVPAAIPQGGFNGA